MQSTYNVMTEPVHLNGPNHQPPSGTTYMTPQPAMANALQLRRARIRVLLADDHRMLREGLRRSLADLGFTVVAGARDGNDAVNLALTTRPDVILMDVTMPDLDGVEATRRIKTQMPETKVVMLTMHADRDVLAEAVKAGASGYLVKDCSTDEIAIAIEAVAAGETALSPGLAASMLADVTRAEQKASQPKLLTKREEEVLQLIANGCSTPEVAEQLYISQKTVKNHLASIYQKLNARDRTQAVIQAVRLGIVSLA